jgi:hypothetical protein
MRAEEVYANRCNERALPGLSVYPATCLAPCLFQQADITTVTLSSEAQHNQKPDWSHRIARRYSGQPKSDAAVHRALQRPRWHSVVHSQSRSIISHSPGGVRPLLNGAPGFTHITSCHPPSGS